MSDQKERNHRARVEGDALNAVNGVVAAKMRDRAYGNSQNEAAIIADCNTRLASAVVSELLRHYTIRPRTRR